MPDLFQVFFRINRLFVIFFCTLGIELFLKIFFIAVIMP